MLLTNLHETEKIIKKRRGKLSKGILFFQDMPHHTKRTQLLKKQKKNRNSIVKARMKV